MNLVAMTNVLPMCLKTFGLAGRSDGEASGGNMGCNVSSECSTAVFGG